MVAFGGGVNSAAMMILLAKQGVHVDVSLFSDTGGERPETYKFIDDFSNWLVKRGLTPITTIHKRSKWKSLEDECLGKKMLPSLAYGFKACSQKWKRDPQDYFANNWPVSRAAWSRGERVVKMLGYDYGESRRVENGIRQDKKYDYVYPLYAAKMDRADCIKMIVESGAPVPAKSSCFFCPASRKPEITDLREKHPDLYARALAIEDNAETTSVRGLGRRFSWRNFVDVDEAQMRFPCDCFDGEEE